MSAPTQAILAAALAVNLVACGAADNERSTEPNSIDAAAPAAGSAPAGVSPNEASKEKTDYLARLTLSRTAARRTLDPNEQAMAIVSGEIRNTGDRVVDRVQVTIHFLDRANHSALEETYQPVLAGASEGDRGPLKAKASRKWAAAFLVPHEWSGKIDVKITDLRLSAQAPSRGSRTPE